MVTLAERYRSIAERRESSRCRPPLSSDSSVVKFNDHGSIITDQRVGSSDDLFIAHRSLVFERSVDWQAIETRTNGTANSNVTSQMVWSAAYINAAVLQDTYSAGVIQPSSRLYFLQDANWNTTAIVGLASGSWQVTQRYVYSPYGSITILNASWGATPSGTQPQVNNLYQGMTLDSTTGLYYARNRNYDPSLGRWINQDPLHYINGANTYQFVESNPVGNEDPWGLSLVTTPPGPSPVVRPSPATPGPLWEPDLAPAPPTGGYSVGMFDPLGDFSPWTAVAAPFFDTPPASGDGDTLQAPWPYNMPHNQKLGPKVQPSPSGSGARTPPKTEDGNPADANPGWWRQEAAGRECRCSAGGWRG